MVPLKTPIARFLKLIRRLLRYLVLTLGVAFLLMIILSFTEQPFWAYYWLGTHNSELEESPDYVVVMGAGGMPSPEGLMRCYYASKAAETFPESKIIIALPTLEEYFYVSHTYKMFKEIHKRGIDSTRFLFEIDGTNTRTQAVEIAEMIPSRDTAALMIITSPEHMYRSVLTFRKMGFKEVGGVPSFEDALDEELLFDKEERKKKIKSLDRNVSLRYNMWNYLKYEISIIRESIAIAYYWVRGWI
ncbi:MAG: YdcF family protein [Bacteroidales bacterium]|nr:YdcF family protein [Bacteroidales bacterium]